MQNNSRSFPKINFIKKIYIKKYIDFSALLTELASHGYLRHMLRLIAINHRLD